MEQNKKSIRLFLLVTLSLSAILEAFIIYSGAMGLAAILMWIPALGAVVTKMVYFRNEKHSLGFNRCKLKYIVAAYLLPLVYIGIPYVIYWITNPGTLQFKMSINFWVMVILGVPISMITALGEEIGWRGFLVPRLLTQVGLEKALIISSAIWALWHYPILLSGLYMAGTPLWYQILMFTIIVGAAGVIIGILTLQSKSVWPAAVYHAAHNCFDQALFGTYTVGDNKMYFVSETGILTAVIIVALAIWMYLSYKKTLVNSSK